MKLYRTSVLLIGLLIVVALVPFAAAAKAPLPPSTSPSVNDNRSPAPSLATNAQTDSMITFSEYPVGTAISNQYANKGIIFGGTNPFITRDGSNPTSPVLSGTPLFQGAIEGTFVSPLDGRTPVTVNSFSLDAGYFDSIGSTQIEWFNPGGSKLGQRTNSHLGIEHFMITGDYIARFRISIIGNESAGYAIDNLVFWRAQEFPVAYFTISTTDKVVTAKDGENLSFSVSEEFNSTITLDLSVQVSSDPAIMYEWFVNDTSIDTQPDVSIDLSEGSNTIKLIVSDTQGHQSTAQSVVNIVALDNSIPLSLSWPFIGTDRGDNGWNTTKGYGEGEGDHQGDDYYAQDWNWRTGYEDWGKVLLSPTGGQVIWVGEGPSEVSGYGRQVIIRDFDHPPYDYAIRLTHLEEVWVHQGDTVCPGTPLGLIGKSSSKRSLSPHLHAAAYLGVFQNSTKWPGGRTGYSWLASGDSAQTPPENKEETLESKAENKGSRFATRFNFDPSALPQGCGTTFAIQGRVLDEKKEWGVGGVTMTLTLRGYQYSSSTTFGRTSGNFAFHGLTQGTYTLTPSKTNCTFTPQSLEISVTDSHIDVGTFTASGKKCKDK